MLNNKPTIVYDPISLRLMESAVHHDHRLKILPFDAIRTIRKLGLNAKHAELPLPEGTIKEKGLYKMEPIKLTWLQLRKSQFMILMSS